MRVAFDMAFGVREGIMCHYCSLGREVGKSPCGGVRPRLSDKRAASASWNALAWRQEPPRCIIPTQGRTVKPYDLSVSVSPRFVPEQSDPGEHQFVFAYTVRITNTGEHPAQVISRHWIITDGNQRVQEVRGLGVVEQQPAGARRDLRIHQRLPAAHPGGHDARHLSLRRRERHPVRGADSEFVLAMPRTLH